MRKLTMDIQRPWRRDLHKEVTLPDRYEEMTGNQFLAVVRLTRGNISEEQFYCMFFDIDSKHLARVDTYQLWVLTSQLSFLKDRQPVTRFFITDVDLRPDESITIRIESPAPRLKGMTWQQFITADTFFNWYHYTGRKAYLHNALAALYLEQGKTFATTDIERVAAEIDRGLDTDTMEAIALNWSLIRLWLSESYTSLFPRPLSDGKQTDGNKKKEKPASWLEIFDTLVENDLTRLESYKTLEAMDVIRILNRRIANQKKKK